MADTELLSSIGELFEGKLSVFKQQIDEKFDLFAQAVDARFDSFAQAVDARFDQVDIRLDKLDKRVGTLEESVSKLDKRVGTLEESVSKFDKRLEQVEYRVKRNEVLHENDILPGLRNITDCYVSTYERYKKYCERMEEVFQDVEVLKCTVQKHSIQLQMIS